MAHHKYYVKEKATGHAVADEHGTTLLCVESDSVTPELVLLSVAESLGVAEDTLEVVVDDEPNIADGVLKAPHQELRHPDDIATAASLKRMIDEFGSLEEPLTHL